MNFENLTVILHALIIFFMHVKFQIDQRLIVWRSKIWASDLGPGTTCHQQYARGEEITEDRCN